MYLFGISLYQTNKITFTEAPVNTVPPSLPRTGAIRTTITCNIGTWNYGTSQPIFTWYNDNRVIEGEDTKDLFIQSEWSGSVIYCDVRVCNVYGCGRAQSNDCTIE